MAWQKSTSTHVAEWRAFSLTFRSMRQLAVWGLLLGIAWGVALAVIYRLPTGKAQSLTEKQVLEQEEKMQKELCRTAPDGLLCNKKKSGPALIK